MMSEGTMVIVMTSIAALGALAMLLAAIRTSYAIEKRSDGTVLWHGLPRYTNMFRTALGGKSIAQDTETRDLVGKLRKQLLFMLVFLALMMLTAIINF